MELGLRWAVCAVLAVCRTRPKRAPVSFHTPPLASPFPGQPLSQALAAPARYILAPQALPMALSCQSVFSAPTASNSVQQRAGCPAFSGCSPLKLDPAWPAGAGRCMWVLALPPNTQVLFPVLFGKSSSTPARKSRNKTLNFLLLSSPIAFAPPLSYLGLVSASQVSPSQHTFFASNRQQATASSKQASERAYPSFWRVCTAKSLPPFPSLSHRPPVQTLSTTTLVHQRTKEPTYLASSTTGPWVWRCVRVVCRPSRPTATLRCPPILHHPPIQTVQPSTTLPPSQQRPPPPSTLHRPTAAAHCQELPGTARTASQTKARRSRTAWSTRSPSDRVALVHPWDPGLASCPHFSQFLHTIPTQLYTWTPGSSKRPFLTPSCIFSQLWEHASIIKLFCCSVHFHLPPSSLPLLRSDLRPSTPPRRLLDPPKGTSNETRAPFLPVSSSLHRPPRRPAVW